MAGGDKDDLRLIETLRRTEDGTFPLLSLHLARLSASAVRLGWGCDLPAVEAALAALPAGCGVRRVRLTLDARGAVEVQSAACPESPSFWRLGLAKERLSSTDPWLQLKTTRRALYDDARKALPPGVDEMVFLNERDELCEGTITTLFLRRDGRLLTPPLASGLLPGVLRRSLIEAGQVEEAILHLPDIRRAEAIFMGNALRGLIPAHPVF